MIPIESGELKNVLNDIRKTEIPGKYGKFAGAVYRYFEDIQELNADGFSLTTLCRFMAERGILPANDSRKFRQAFRREFERRKAKSKGSSIVHDSANSRSAKPIDPPVFEMTERGGTEEPQAAKLVSIVGADGTEFEIDPDTGYRTFRIGQATPPVPPFGKEKNS